MIIAARPPNFDAILKAFPDADKPGVIFAYGDDIFNPGGHEIPSALLAHERVHCSRQQAPQGAERWWYLYITDAEFRYREEVLAHIAEFLDQNQRCRDRNDRARLLQSMARRLIAPLYNYQPPRSLSQAMRDLRQEIDR
jgi:hypothetical protein